MTITVTPKQHKISVEVLLEGGFLKKRYARKGDCIRCGMCCINENCEHFVMGKKTEIATCEIYESPNRPLRCKLFPEMPPILFESCGYYFLDAWENNKKVKRHL